MKTRIIVFALVGAIALAIVVVVAASVLLAALFPPVPVMTTQLYHPMPTLMTDTPPAPTGADICITISGDKVGQAVGAQVTSVTALPGDPTFGPGCQYVMGQESEGIYVNLFFAPEESFAKIRASSGEVTPIDSLGDGAYIATRPDSPQLWVLVRGKGAVVVAIGGVWTPGRARPLASYVLDFVK